MKVLGTFFPSTGSLDEELANRTARAWQAFHSLKKLLCRRTCPLKQRLRLLDMTVLKGFTWCAEVWNLTQLQQRRMNTMHKTMVQQMMGLKRDIW